MNKYSCLKCGQSVSLSTHDSLVCECGNSQIVRDDEDFVSDFNFATDTLTISNFTNGVVLKTNNPMIITKAIRGYKVNPQILKYIYFRDVVSKDIFLCGLEGWEIIVHHMLLATSNMYRFCFFNKYHSICKDLILRGSIYSYNLSPTNSQIENYFKEYIDYIISNTNNEFDHAIIIEGLCRGLNRDEVYVLCIGNVSIFQYEYLKENTIFEKEIILHHIKDLSKYKYSEKDICKIIVEFNILLKEINKIYTYNINLYNNIELNILKIRHKLSILQALEHKNQRLINGIYHNSYKDNEIYASKDREFIIRIANEKIALKYLNNIPELDELTSVPLVVLRRQGEIYKVQAVIYEVVFMGRKGKFLSGNSSPEILRFVNEYNDKIIGNC